MSGRQAKLLDGDTGKWEVVIGMEVHAQVTSNAKLFSGASTKFGAEPNSQVSLIDAAMPGMLPVINRYCVEQAIKTGLGLKAKINLTSVFDRKNYFYPDLPAGYQISQYKHPIVGEGEVTLDLPNGESVKVGIERVHMEQDAGKSLHDQHPDYSYVDLNRSGIALMEIVSCPDMRSAEEGAAFLRKLRAILRYLGTCDGNMDEGSMRADVNVSVRKPGAPLGTRAEIKNVNSMRFVAAAIEFEARRQIGILETGGKITQETRLFDSKNSETRSMRSKEEAHDYRYFPDPDLLPLTFEQNWVDEIARGLPELPDEKKARFISAGLSPYDASVLVVEKERAEYYETMVKEGAEPKAAAKWLLNEYLGRLNELPPGQQLTDASVCSPNYHVAINSVRENINTRLLLETVSPSANSAIVQKISSGKISGKMGKDILDEKMRQPDKDINEIMEKYGEQITDTAAIEKTVDAVIAANPGKVEEVKAKPKLAAWFVGQVMKQTGGKANPQTVNTILQRKLGITGEG